MVVQHCTTCVSLLKTERKNIRAILKAQCCVMNVGPTTIPLCCTLISTAFLSVTNSAKVIEVCLEFGGLRFQIAAHVLVKLLE